MTYKELQTTLKGYKAQGLTQIKLNATQAELQAEYDRLTTPVEKVETIDSVEFELNRAEHMGGVYLRNLQEANRNGWVEDAKGWCEKLKQQDKKVARLMEKLEKMKTNTAKKDNQQEVIQTQIVKLTKTSAVVMKVNGKAKTVKVQSVHNVEDVIGYLNSDDDIKFVFKYYLAIFPSNKFLLKRYNVYFPTKQQMTDKEIDRQIRERYYESFECVRLLKQNELEVTQYIGSLRN